MLICEVLKSELQRISKTLYELKSEEKNLAESLDSYLSLIAKEEDLYVVIAKEFSFLNSAIRNEIISTETIVRNIFYTKIEQGINQNKYKPVNPTVAISFLFATINYYLSRKEYYTNRVIQAKKDKIIETFLTLLKK